MRFIQGMILLLSSLTGADAAVSTLAIPEPLRPWLDWVLQGEDQRRCPLLYSETTGRRCAWPSALRLELGTQGGRFEQVWHVDAESWLALPGDHRHWPQGVTLDGIPVAVLEREDQPALKAGPGEHHIVGDFRWHALPESLRLPADTALLKVVVNNVEIANPRLEAEGTLWLRQRKATAENAQDHLELQVFRKIADGVPLTLDTRLNLRVAGQAREVRLGPVLPQDFTPLSLRSPLPARLESDGALRLQVKPGEWLVEIGARHRSPVETLSRPLANPPWPEQEVWSFEAANAVRVVTVTGATALDPAQTNLPGEWRTLPSYLMLPDTALRFITRQRGASAAPDQLSLHRHLWLDFDGDGYTAQDHIQGTVSSASRLAATELQLGRVALDGQDQFITRLPGSDTDGVELRRGQLQLNADSRLLPAQLGDLPAVGWRLSPSTLSTTLNLPPGWRLLAADGPDGVSDAWAFQWTLLDLFIVLITAIAFARLWGWPWGIVALFGLTAIYQEPDAPRLLWLNLLAAIALLRVLPPGRLQMLVRGYRHISLLALVLICLVFAVQQVRGGLYPQLSRSSATSYFGDGYRLEGFMVPSAAPPAAEEAVSVAGAKPAAPASRDMLAKSGQRPVYSPDIKVQTGPGLPNWQWSRSELRWNGPVSADARLWLWLLPPWASRLLAFLGVGLMLTLLARTAEIALPRPRTLLPLLALGVLAPPADEARADMPTPELLNELRQRLLEPPDCAPRCAALASLEIKASATDLHLALALHAQADSAIPLPIRLLRITPIRVSLDGDDAPLYRAGDGTPWLRLPAGLHKVTIDAPLPSDLLTLQLPLPMAPGRVDLVLDGWNAEGVTDGSTDGRQIQLSRQQRDAASTLEPGVLPVFISVERELNLGIDWQVRTRIKRLSQADAAAVLSIPLLPGERPTTLGIQIREGRVQINLPPEQPQLEWLSVLEQSDRIELKAAETGDFVEVWRLQAAPIWHIEAAGIPVIHHYDPVGDWTPEWRPWPGETLILAISRPVGVAGQITTIDQSTLRLQPGERLSDVRLELAVRSSRGTDHTLTLPATAELVEVLINDRSQPLQLREGKLTLPLTPGSQRIVVHWREPQGITRWYRTPIVDLGSDSVNSHIVLTLPHDRWTLLAGGPTLGPAVLFWGLLLVIALAAVALGRYSGTPLGAWQWLLLGVGLSQSTPLAALAVVGWLVLLGRRERLSDAIGNTAFNLLQVLLVILTLAALAALAEAIQQGLLGAPEMQITGNGSSAYELKWYQDRSGTVLPQAWTVSVPMLVYRLLMLAWALWLAFALLRWLGWGWHCFSHGGLWRRLQLRQAKP